MSPLTESKRHARAQHENRIKGLVLDGFSEKVAVETLGASPPLTDEQFAALQAELAKPRYADKTPMEAAFLLGEATILDDSVEPPVYGPTYLQLNVGVDSVLISDVEEAQK